MNRDPRFEIRRLGDCTYSSPLHLSKETGDNVANYVSEDERVVLHTSIRSWEEYRDQGEDPPSLELAGPREKIFFEQFSISEPFEGFCVILGNLH